MRLKNLFLLFLVLSGLAYGQTENFFAESSTVTWQKVYETDLSLPNLLTKFKESGLFYSVESENDKIFLKFKNARTDYKSLGLSAATVSSYIATGKFEAMATVEFKEGKYRTTLNNIDYNYSYLSVATLNDVNDVFDLEQVGLKKNSNEFKNGFVKRDIKVLNYTFSNLFDVEKYKQNDSNW